MPYPFPGMNPYLENSQFWPAVHNRLIVAIADALSAQVLPKYIVDIEKRIYKINEEDSLLVVTQDVKKQHLQNQINSSTSNVAVAAPPATSTKVRVPIPLEFREGYLELREIATGQVVTVIELLSPTNKRPGEGRETYLKKREEVLGSRTHLVEIDLLRGWEAMPVFGNNLTSNYGILISRADRRPTADLYQFNLQNPIPSFLIPLRSEDVEPNLDIQQLIVGIYDRAGYDFVIDYNSEMVPPLSENDAAWVDVWLREKKLRA